MRWELVAALVAAATPAFAQNSYDRLAGSWPNGAEIADERVHEVSFPSRSPFVLEDVGGSEEMDPPTEAKGYLFLPEGASAARKVPAIVMIHGSGGILRAREMTYGPQFAKMGVAGLAVDVFGARRHIATSYVDRMLRITETMLVADAYAALRYLAGRPEIDPRRVALAGYSYGALAAMLAAYAQVAEAFAPEGLRFAAHISYYGPCLSTFEDNRATGAPLLLLSASEDKVTDPVRCAEAAKELMAGGARVESVRYDGAYHQWDGSAMGPVRRSRNLSSCAFRVERDGTARDLASGMAMTNVFTRQIILAMCSNSDGYLQHRDDSVREMSNFAAGRFLARAFADGAPVPNGAPARR
jgi:dienelactone hydrolase